MNLYFEKKRLFVHGLWTNKATSLIIIFAILAAGCKKFVEVAPPTSSLSSSIVFKDASTATAAQTALYSQMEPSGYYMSLNTGLLCDELKTYATSGIQLDHYLNALRSISAPTTWTESYNLIYKINAVIEGLSANYIQSKNVSNQLLGEAKFLRAFWYFQLVNLYGDVPLILSTDYKVNSALARSSVSDVYVQIKTDLIDAKSLLNTNWVDITDTVSTTERVRPNKSAASALLARVYLFNQEWLNAVNEATTVISNNNFSLTSLDDVFLKNSKEAIFQLQIPQPRSYNTTDGYSYILLGMPGTGIANSSTVSNSLLNAFENNDARKAKWLKSITVSNVNYTFPYKYKINNGATVTEYTMVLRLAEQYLIRAEAQAQLNSLNASQADLNIIRIRAGLPNYSGSNDKNSIIAAILHERQVEFFSEWGHRWFDLKRTNTVDALMNSISPGKGGSWEATDKLYPISLVELNANPKLIQNPGY